MEAIVGIIVGTFAVYVAYRRIAFVGAVFDRRAKLARFEKALRQAREHASGPSPWRIAGEQDRELVALLGAAARDEHELTARGFRGLGDLVGQWRGQEPSLAMRVLVKDDVVAGLLVSRAAPQNPRLSLSSYGPEKQLTTSRGGDGRSLAMPPWLHITHLGAGTSIDDVILEHTAFLPADLRELTTLDEVLANSASQRERLQRWRDAQPPDELLEADLRGMLGAHHAKAGAYWFKKLRGKLPDARLRR